VACRVGAEGTTAQGIQPEILTDESKNFSKKLKNLNFLQDKKCRDLPYPGHRRTLERHWAAKPTVHNSYSYRAYSVSLSSVTAWEPGHLGYGHLSAILTIRPISIAHSAYGSGINEIIIV